ncbi:hypothetical protein L0337_31735 [candidate division KSB1 bacterium]|nr:hypothetical protein [candidate division KSB1 bacterium]
MFSADKLEVWNLTPNSNALVGAQRIFNVVGRLRSPHATIKLLYSLNNGSEKSVWFNANEKRSTRLEYHGDFNIDTIEAADLKPRNRLAFRIVNGAIEQPKYDLIFSTHAILEELPQFRLNLEGVDNPEQVGQIVDGKWRVSRDENHEPCLEILKEDAGLDRIILFGRHDWTTGYEITARICVTAWTTNTHNVGLVFKWNPHLQGDGTHLPSQWSTGLGYYYSRCPGLRIRFGVDVHLDKDGNKLGDHILQEATLSWWRRWVGRFGNKVFYKALPRIYPLSQFVPGVQYRLRLIVRPEKYALTVWKNGKKEPHPQVLVLNPIEKLACGSTGVIALNCGVRVYEFNVTPF